MSEWVTVGRVDELGENALMAATVEGEEVVVASVGGEYRALGATCTHEGGPLYEGEIDDGAVMCPWHGSLFDLHSGEAVGPPAEEGVAVYEVRVEADELQVRAPAAARRSE
jgi:3-phenylpropionate/trans-cinnamate dioxygenase ferredoxin component